MCERKRENDMSVGGVRGEARCGWGGVGVYHVVVRAKGRRLAFWPDFIVREN